MKKSTNSHLPRITKEGIWQIGKRMKEDGILKKDWDDEMTNDVKLLFKLFNNLKK